MPFIKTSKRAYRSPASALRCATWCIACLIRLVQANPTVTNCALLFTLITPSEKVGLCWARPRSTSGSQRSQSSRVATSGVNTDLRRPPRTPRLRLAPSFSTHSAAQLRLHAPFTERLMCNNAKSRVLRLEIWGNMHIRSPAADLWPAHVPLSV